MSARITVGKYIIKADIGTGWVAGVPKMVSREQEDGTSKLVEVMDGPTYHGRVDHALTRLLDRSIRESDARSLADVRDLIVAFRKECAPIFEVTK